MVTGFSASESYFDIGWSRYDYDDGKFYYGSDGRRCYYIGWRVIDGKWYYLDPNGIMLTGWLKDDSSGDWYYLSPNGDMVSGGSSMV